MARDISPRAQSVTRTRVARHRATGSREPRPISLDQAGPATQRIKEVSGEEGVAAAARSADRRRSSLSVRQPLDRQNAPRGAEAALHGAGMAVEVTLLEGGVEPVIR